MANFLLFSVCLLVAALSFKTPGCQSRGIGLEEKDGENKRFIHGCPFMFPCPPPPCDNPVYGLHDCCGHCPDREPETTVGSSTDEPGTSVVRAADAGNATCPNPCVFNGQHFCFHIPCPLPRCGVPLVLTPGDCCEHCPTPAGCQTCRLDGKDVCEPVPCRVAPCFDHVLSPGDCCPHCPNGPQCRYQGQVVKEGDKVTTSSEECRCVVGGVDGGQMECTLGAPQKPSNWPPSH